MELIRLLLCAASTERERERLSRLLLSDRRCVRPILLLLSERLFFGCRLLGSQSPQNAEKKKNTKQREGHTNADSAQCSNSDAGSKMHKLMDIDAALSCRCR